MQPPTYQVRTPDGRVWGPLTDEQVRTSIQNGGITPNSFITTAGLEAWAPVWQHPVFGPVARVVPAQALPGAPRGVRRREMSAGKIVALVLGGVVVLLALAAIPIFYVINSSTKSFRALLNESEKPQTLVAEDGMAQLSFPAGWRKDSTLNDDANIQASGHFQSAFAIVISEPKANFDPGTNAQDYSDLTRSSLREGLKNSREMGPRTLTVGGHPAVQYQVTGTAEGIDLVMLHHSLETPKNFHQVLVWTPRNQFAQRRAELEKIVQSFREPVRGRQKAEGGRQKAEGGKQ